MNVHSCIMVSMLVVEQLSSIIGEFGIIMSETWSEIVIRSEISEMSEN